jgi:hypothetical protein
VLNFSRPTASLASLSPLFAAESDANNQYDKSK